jgi:hypothetical protein
MQQTASHAVPPHVQLVQMATGEWVARALHAAAELGLADQLANVPKSAAELAGPMHVDAPSLHRFMRTLASLGVLTEQPEQRYALTALGEALRTGAPGSARATLLTLGGHWVQRSWDHLIYSIHTGKPAFDRAHSMPLFEYLAQHHDEASLFSEMMVGLHSQEPCAVATAYDFSAFKTIVDVGGATGQLLANILCRYAGPSGVLFDLPHVVADAPSLLEENGVRDRVKIEAGDFFKTVPSGGDAYILSRVIHDWDEHQCLTILGHIRKAIKSNGRLLIVEMVLPEGDTPHLGKMFDMVMLLVTTGRERMEAEYASLLSKSGFKLTRVVPTSSAVSVVEAVLA